MLPSTGSHSMHISDAIRLMASVVLVQCAEGMEMRAGAHLQPGAALLGHGLDGSLLVLSTPSCCCRLHQLRQDV